MLWRFDLKRATIRVDKITNVNGAAADIQKSFGFRNPCIDQKNLETEYKNLG